MTVRLCTCFQLLCVPGTTKIGETETAFTPGKWLPFSRFGTNRGMPLGLGSHAGLLFSASKRVPGIGDVPVLQVESRTEPVVIIGQGFLIKS